MDFIQIIEQFFNSQAVQTALSMFNTIGVTGALILIALYNKLTDKNSTGLQENTDTTNATRDILTAVSNKVDKEAEQLQALTQILTVITSDSNISVEKKQKVVNILEGIGFATEQAQNIKDSIIEDATEKEEQIQSVLEKLSS